MLVGSQAGGKSANTPMSMSTLTPFSQDGPTWVYRNHLPEFDASLQFVHRQDARQGHPTDESRETGGEDRHAVQDRLGRCLRHPASAKSRTAQPARTLLRQTVEQRHISGMPVISTRTAMAYQCHPEQNAAGDERPLVPVVNPICSTVIEHSDEHPHGARDSQWEPCAVPVSSGQR